MHLPRFSLDIFINFAARKGSGIVNQYLVWLWPLRPDHYLHHKLFMCASIVGIIVFLFGTMTRFLFVVLPPTYSNQSQFKAVTIV